MNKLQTRLELRVSAQQWVDSIMSQFNISAAEMEDALNKVLLNLNQQILKDYLTEQQQAYQEARMASGSTEDYPIQEEDTNNDFDI